MSLDRGEPTRTKEQHENISIINLKETNKFSFNCNYTNAHSVVQKLPEVSNLLIEHDVKISGITVSWPSADINDVELQIEIIILMCIGKTD